MDDFLIDLRPPFFGAAVYLTSLYSNEYLVYLGNSPAGGPDELYFPFPSLSAQLL